MRVNIYTPINTLGFGVWGVNFAYAMCKERCENNVNIFAVNPFNMDMRDYGLSNKKVYETLANRIQRSCFDFDPSIPSINIWHPNDQARFVGKPRIAYTMFETNELLPVEKLHLNSVDRVWVPTKWAKNVLINNGIVKPIDVVPAGVDTDFYRPTPKGQSYLSSSLASKRLDGYKVFFSGGKLEKRKGHYAILEALDKYIVKAGHDEKIVLIAHWANPFIQNYDSELDKILQSYGWERSSELGPGTNEYTCKNLSLITVPRSLSFIDIRNVYAESDVGLFPAFGEGWNLPLIEMMSMGIPCIATNYSGHTGYVDKDNCYLIENGTFVSANDGVWFHGNRGAWKEIDPEDIAESILSMYNMPDENIISMTSNARETCLNTTWVNSAKQAIECLKEL
jgi:glycosyltransferase involved in cell wall biosynthesis